MIILKLTLIGVGGIVVIEVLVAGAVSWLRKKCAWLITARDQLPEIDPAGLDAFMEHGWDAELGWVRKPNTRHGEMGREGIRTSYSLDHHGARHNPGFDDKPVEILAYGDSYTFARQVNNHEAWPHLVSKTLNKNVANFGVGNYGLDQALLRLEREYHLHPSKIVLMGVVPETICRIHSVWKHFSEYGNTFGFKPRFHLNDGELELFENLINTREKYFQIADYYDQLAQNDYFYEKKFCKDILTFPYALSLLRSWRRNSAMMFFAFTDRLGITEDAAFIHVMNRNIDMAKQLFEDDDGTALFKAVCRRFQSFCHHHGAEPVLVIMPQLMDMRRIKKGDHYYKGVLDDLATECRVVDLAPALLGYENIDPLFIHDHYGGHLSTEGNQIVANVVATLCKDIIDTKFPASDTVDKDLYPFDSGDLLNEPNTYFYTKFSGTAFLDAWKKHREQLLSTFPTTGMPSQPPSHGFLEDGQVNTARLLEYVYHELDSQHWRKKEITDWLEKLLKKFEVTKRIHGAYDHNFRAVDRNDHKHAPNYLHLAEIFELAWRQAGEFPYLNALLKILDTLSSLRHMLNEEELARLSVLVKAEKQHISDVAKSVNVKL